MAGPKMSRHLCELGYHSVVRIRLPTDLDGTLIEEHSRILPFNPDPTRICHDQGG